MATPPKKLAFLLQQKLLNKLQPELLFKPIHPAVELTLKAYRKRSDEAKNLIEVDMAFDSLIHELNLSTP